jgi:hypothetical protein
VNQNVEDEVHQVGVTAAMVLQEIESRYTSVVQCNQLAIDHRVRRQLLQLQSDLEELAR